MIAMTASDKEVKGMDMILLMKLTKTWRQAISLVTHSLTLHIELHRNYLTLTKGTSTIMPQTKTSALSRTKDMIKIQSQFIVKCTPIGSLI